jgi:hypothetical protein
MLPVIGHKDLHVCFNRSGDDAGIRPVTGVLKASLDRFLARGWGCGGPSESKVLRQARDPSAADLDIVVNLRHEDLFGLVKDISADTYIEEVFGPEAEQTDPR